MMRVGIGKPAARMKMHMTQRVREDGRLIIPSCRTYDVHDATMHIAADGTIWHPFMQ
jgi:hypothetical protein